ncbi:MAG TPA: serine/threonine-protein kinase PknK, partial [Byssovorax sp.]
ARVVALARAALAVALGHLGDLEPAKAAALDALRAFTSHGDTRAEAITRAHFARLCDASGDAAGALREARAASAALAPLPAAHAYALAVESRALGHRGDVDGALAAASRASQILDRLGALAEGEAFVRLAHVEALIAAGRPARPALDAAARRLHERAARIEPPGARRAFLERIVEHRRTLELAARG